MTAPPDIYTGLRATFLGTRRADLVGVPPEAAYAMLYEVGHAGSAVTLAATAQGDASFYNSRGGGAIGGIGNAAVREAAKALVALANQLLERTASLPEPAPPGNGEIRIVLLTDAGPRSVVYTTATKFAPGDAVIQLTRDSSALMGLLVKAPAAAMAVPPS